MKTAINIPAKTPPSSDEFWMTEIWEIETDPLVIVVD